MNKVILCGNLGADAEVKFTQGGQCVSSLRLCTTEKWTNKDGRKEERSEWHHCVWWGKGAEVVSKFLTKGKRVLIEGKIQTRTWDNKEGVKQYKTEINVSSVELLSFENNNQRGAQNTRQLSDADDSQGGDGSFNPYAATGDDNVPY